MSFAASIFPVSSSTFWPLASSSFCRSFSLFSRVSVDSPVPFICVSFSFNSARNAFNDDSACFSPLVSSFVSARNFTLASLLLNQSPSLQHLFFCICLPRFICIFVFQDRKQGIIFRIPEYILTDSIHNHVIDVHIFHGFNLEPWKS